jgi:hypothetical protein
MSEKNEMVSLNEAQKDPYKAKGSDFSVKNVRSEPFQSGGSKGMAEGKDELVKLSSGQQGPRRTQDEGDLTPSKWGKGDFSIGKNDEGGSSVSFDDSVDLVSGKIICKGYKPSVVGEVPQCGVKLG